MNIQEARELLAEYTKGESLLRHARSVELVMEAYAKKLGEDSEEWAVTGLLHDADYEAYPEEHPNIIVKLLREKGEEKIAHAISAHYTKWGVEYTNSLDKGLLACDELTGFIIAYAILRPNGIEGLKAKSIIKKLKQKAFAASVDREEISKGVELFEVDLSEHISFIIQVLTENKEELQIVGGEA